MDQREGAAGTSVSCKEGHPAPRRVGGRVAPADGKMGRSPSRAVDRGTHLRSVSLQEAWQLSLHREGIVQPVDEHNEDVIKPGDPMIPITLLILARGFWTSLELHSIPTYSFSA